MENMKLSISSILSLLGFLLLLTACGENPTEDFKTADANNRNYLGSIRQGHKVYGTHPSDFQARVKSFLSFIQPYDASGSISHSESDKLRGVFFKMTVELGEEREDSIDFFVLSIQVIDSFVGQPNYETNEIYQPLTFHIDSRENEGARMTLTGDYHVNREGIPSSGDLQLSFEGQYTTLDFYGKVNNGQFRGEIRFSNKVNYDAHYRGESGALGLFDVPVCGIFVCEK